MVDSEQIDEELVFLNTPKITPIKRNINRLNHPTCDKSGRYNKEHAALFEKKETLADTLRIKSPAVTIKGKLKGVTRLRSPCGVDLTAAHHAQGLHPSIRLWDRKCRRRRQASPFCQGGRMHLNRGFQFGLSCAISASTLAPNP